VPGGPSGQVSVRILRRGNMSAAVRLPAKQGGGPVFRHQVLVYPVTDARFDTESYRHSPPATTCVATACSGPGTSTHRPAQPAEPTASPLRASLEQLAGLPPALVITAEADVVRDEGEASADKLRDAGVAVAADRFHAIIHDFVMLNASPTPTPPGRHHPGHRHVASGVLRQALRLGPSDRCHNATTWAAKVAPTK
jgi:acetyl esterase/lipase